MNIIINMHQNIGTYEVMKKMRWRRTLFSNKAICSNCKQEQWDEFGKSLQDPTRELNMTPQHYIVYVWVFRVMFQQLVQLFFFACSVMTRIQYIQ